LAIVDRKFEMLTKSVTSVGTNGKQSPRVEERPDNWPRDILQAYARGQGPYTVDNANTILEEEAVELYNGWLVWQEMTNPIERRVVANLQAMLDLSARKAGFGQAMPDQLECLLSNGDVIKPDASLLSWQNLESGLVPTGPNERPLLRGCPELVIEVRSPSNWRAQERRKRQLYFTNQTQIVWDVDEANQGIWVFRAENPEEPTLYQMGDEITCEPLLPGWRRALAHIFAEEASAEAVAGEVAVAWRAEGVEIGATQRSREIARTMLEEGIDPGLIAKVTGLSQAQLSGLR
jgi:Uma2 family endonuclease